MKAYELRIVGVESEAALAAVRLELFVFPDVRQLCRIGLTDRVVVLYVGERADVVGWIEVLGRAGYTAEALASEPPLAAA